MQEVLVTLRVDTLDYDESNDRYTVTLNGCVLAQNGDDHKESVTFVINDPSKVVNVDRSKFISSQPIKTVEDDQKMEENATISSNNAMITSRDKWFMIFWALYIILAVLVFVVIEHDSFVTALYFRIVTSFGVGYGDYYPRTATGKMLNCLFIVIDLAKLAYIDWRIISVLFKYRQKSLTLAHLYHESTPTPHPRFEHARNVEDSALELTLIKIVNHRNLLIYIALLLCLFFISGTMVMCLTEGYNWLDGLEWNFVTLSQVGYGNTIPKTNGGMIFSVFYIILGYVLLLSTAVIIFDNFMHKMMQQNAQKKANIESVGLLSQ